MTNKYKVCVLCSRFSRTGVPLAQIRLARALVSAGCDVDLIFGYIDVEENLENLEGVKIILWQCRRAMYMLPGLIKYIYQNKPDLIITAEDNTNAFLLLASILTRAKSKITASSRISPETVYSDKFFSRGWLLKKFVRSVMYRADVWSCVSKDLAEKYQLLFPEKKIEYIYNVIDDEMSRLRLRDDVQHPWFNERVSNICITAGTLHERKGLFYLIGAISLLDKKGIDVRLMILGDGPQEGELRELVNDLGLSGRVTFVGSVSNPLKYFSRAKVFVLSSLQEGMPNVLIESMLAGCTPVATDCPTGPREILANGRYGYLVPMRDSVALASGIESALSHPVPPEVLAEAVVPFRKEAVLAKLFQLLDI